MNLIDILNQILSTKNELRVIVEEKSTDFSILPITIYNYLIKFYNSGFNNGYRDKFLEETDTGAWSKDPLTPKEYSPNSINYDPYTLDGLVDMMESVLGYRLDIKDVIDIDSDQFIIYPDRLRFLVDTMNSTGYDEGRNTAASVLSVSETIETPTFSWDSSTNTFTITTLDTSLEIWYKLGVTGVVVRYTNPVQLSSTTRVYYYASAGASTSNKNTYYDCTVTLSDAEEYLPSPSISQNGNSFSIVSTVQNGTIYYNINDSNWKIFKYPVNITGPNWSIEYYVSDGEKTSRVLSTDLRYYSDQTNINKCVNVSLTQSSNTITLYTPTGNSNIYYKINDGEYQLYSTPFTISSACIVYAYVTKEGYEDSDVLYWSLTLGSSSITPNAPLIYQTEYILKIHSYNPGAEIQYKYRYNDPWTSLGSSSTDITLFPEANTRVWAKVILNGVSSNISEYYFYYYKDGFTIPAPVLSIINNRVVITNEGYTTYYTVDGTDPRRNGNVYRGNSDGFSGIIINGPTLVRAISAGRDESNHVFWSEEVSNTFTPLSEGEEGYYISNEFFFVEGATEIHLSDIRSGIAYNLAYSYDKNEWTKFREEVTGLDSGKRVYLKDASGTVRYRSFKTISFGAGDRVSVGGNILSIIYSGMEYWYKETNTSTESTFEGLFKNCTQLVDASKLVIPITMMQRNDFKEMFYGCSNLETGPKELYFEDVVDYGCYDMFNGCSKMITSPKFNIKTIKEYGCKRMFANCPKINSVSRFNISSIGQNGLEECFLNDYGLRKVDMVINDVDIESYMNTFRNCRSLSTRTYINDSYYIDSIRIATPKLANSCFYGTFSECYALEEFGDLPGIYANSYCYYQMFLNASNLRKVGTIALTTTSTACLYSTFEGTGLEKAPDLLPPNLNGDNCYARLFYNCSSLNYIKALFLTDPSSAQFTKNWVKGVASEGTFVQDMDATWNEVSVNAIPIGWSVNKESNDVGVITNIRCTDGQVSIWADRETEILYQINNTDGEWKLYTAPFNISVDSVIYARCRNNRGELGKIYQSELFKITASTSLIITYSNNYIILEAPTGVEYNHIYYKLADYKNNNFDSDWINYTGPIQIFKSVTIQAYGVGEGNVRSSVEYLDVLFGVDTPKISCVNNTITLTCSTLGYDRIEYKFNLSDDWSIYTSPITIDSDKTIYARSSIIDSNGIRVYSDPVSCRCFYDTGEEEQIILYTPVFSRYNNENKYVLYYNNFLYSVWNPSEHDDVHIKYRESYDGGYTWTVWMEYEKMGSFTHNIYVEVYAYKENKESEHGVYQFTYSGGSVPLAPRIVFNPDNNIVAIYGRDDCSIYYSFDDVTYYLYESFFMIDRTVTVYAYQVQNGTGVKGTVTSSLCNYNPPPTNIDPVISFDSNAGICTISGVGKIYYRINWEANNSSREYTQPLKYLNGDMSVTAWAEYNGYRSNNVTTNCLWTGGRQIPNPPTIVQVPLSEGVYAGYVYNEYSNVQIYWTDFGAWINNAWSEAAAPPKGLLNLNRSDIPSPVVQTIQNTPCTYIAYSEGNENSLVFKVINDDTYNYTMVNNKPVLSKNNNNKVVFGNVPAEATLKVSTNGVDWSIVSAGEYEPEKLKCYVYAYYIYEDTVSDVGYIKYEREISYPTVNVYEWNSDENGYYITMEGNRVFYGPRFQQGVSYTSPFYDSLSNVLCVWELYEFDNSGIQIYAASSNDIVFTYYKLGQVVRTEHRTPAPTPTPPVEWPKTFECDDLFTITFDKVYSPAHNQELLTVRCSSSNGDSVGMIFQNIVYDSNTPDSYLNYGDKYNSGYSDFYHNIGASSEYGNYKSILNGYTYQLPYLNSVTLIVFLVDFHSASVLIGGQWHPAVDGKYITINLHK